MEIGIRFVRANIFPRLVSILASAYVSNRKNRSTRREREIETIFSFETELSSPPTFLSSPFHIFPRNDLSESFPPSLPSPPLSGSRFISHNRFAKVEGSMFGNRDENKYGRKETFDFFYRATSTRQLSTREASRSAAQFYVIPYLADTSGSGGLARRHDASWRANEGEFG